MSRQITIAFAGTGEVKQETVNALLDDWLEFGPTDKDGFAEPSEHDITVILPVTTDHWNANLAKVWNWTEHADLPYTAVLAKNDNSGEIAQARSDAESFFTVVNVNKKVIDLLKDAAGEKFLVLLWGDGDEGDEDSENLLDLASAAEIPVKDLTDGLDDIQFDDEMPEPEPEPVKPARGSRRGAATKTVAETPLVSEETPLVSEEEPLVSEETPLTADDPEEVKAVDRAAVPQFTEMQRANLADVDCEYLMGALQSIYLFSRAYDETNAYRNLDETRESPLTELVREALEHVTYGDPGYDGIPPGKKAVEPPQPVAEPEQPKRGRGRPRTKPVTVAYYRTQDDIYRKAGRGRPRRGEERVELTAEDIDRLTREERIDDED